MLLANSVVCVSVVKPEQVKLATVTGPPIEPTSVLRVHALFVELYVNDMPFTVATCPFVGPDGNDIIDPYAVYDPEDLNIKTVLVPLTKTVGDPVVIPL